MARSHRPKSKTVWCHAGGHWFRYTGTITDKQSPFDCDRHRQ